MAGSPTQPSQRNLTIDVLHGAALLGVLLADFPMYAMRLDRALAAPRSASGLEGLAAAALAALVHTKFLTILTLLFGSSLAILEAKDGGGESFSRAYLRRLAFLFALGAAHTALVWHSILLLYAPCGLAAFWLRSRSTATLLKTSLAVLALGAALPFAAAAIILSLRVYPDPAWFLQNLLRLDSATWIGVAGFRFRQFLLFYAPAALLLFGLRTLAVMLLGICMYRGSCFAEENLHNPWPRRLAVWGTAIGLPLSAAAASSGMAPSIAALVARWLAFYFGGLSLSLGYVGLISLACREPAWRPRLAPLAKVGRMCLSSFVLGSAAFSLLAYPFGFGLYGRVGHVHCAAVSLATFLALERLSALWLARFRFGPLEWLLRTASYGRAPRMRA